MKPPEHSRRWNVLNVCTQTGSARAISSQCVVTYQSSLESVNPFRRWQRVLSPWPCKPCWHGLLGGDSPFWKEHRSSGSPCPVFGGPDPEKEFESSQGQVPASSAQSVGTGCGAATVATTAPCILCHLPCSTPKEGPVTSPALSRGRGMIIPIFQVRLRGFRAL